MSKSRLKINSRNVAAVDAYCEACNDHISTGCETYDSNGNTFCPRCWAEREHKVEVADEDYFDDDMFF